MKSLVNPFLWFLVLQIALLATLRFCDWDKANRPRKLCWNLLLFSVFGLIVLSTPVAKKTFERTLSIEEADRVPGAPAYIFVLGSGFIPGVSPQGDVLVEECNRRVLAGVALWQEHHEAKLVLVGASRELGGRSSGRMTQLMAKTAVFHGVPERQLMLEPRSRNTQEHPSEALKLPGMTPETPVAIVTSSYHMRRAKQEFARYFTHILFRSVPTQPTTLGWQDFIPNPDALECNTTYLQEFIGIAWYNASSGGDKCFLSLI